MLVIISGPEYRFRLGDSFNWPITATDLDNLLVWNVQPLHTGRHKIAGTVTVDGIPARRNIIACRRGTLEYVAGTTSDPTTGAWELPGLLEYPEESLIVLALDNTGEYNAVVTDYISQVSTTP